LGSFGSRERRDFASIASYASLASELIAALPWSSKPFEGPLSGDRLRLQQRYRCTLHQCRVRAGSSHTADRATRLPGQDLRTAPPQGGFEPRPPKFCNAAIFRYL